MGYKIIWEVWDLWVWLNLANVQNERKGNIGVKLVRLFKKGLKSFNGRGDAFEVRCNRLRKKG